MGYLESFLQLLLILGGFGLFVVGMTSVAETGVGQLKLAFIGLAISSLGFIYAYIGSWEEVSFYSFKKRLRVAVAITLVFGGIASFLIGILYLLNGLGFKGVAYVSGGLAAVLIAVRMEKKRVREALDWAEWALY